jgi:hypothetical protein
MDAEIHSVDNNRRDSEGRKLYVRLGKIQLAVKRHEDELPFGQHKDQHYLEVKASSWEDATKSTLTAELDSEELQQLFQVALEAGLLEPGVSPRVVELLEQLREELAVGGPGRSLRKHRDAVGD